MTGDDGEGLREAVHDAYDGMARLDGLEDRVLRQVRARGRVRRPLRASLAGLATTAVLVFLIGSVALGGRIHGGRPTSAARPAALASPTGATANATDHASPGAVNLPTSEATPSPSPSNRPATTPRPTGPAASPTGPPWTYPFCGPGDVTRTVSTDHTDYTVGQAVVITVTLNYHTAKDCFMDEGFHATTDITSPANLDESTHHYTDCFVHFDYPGDAHVPAGDISTSVRSCTWDQRDLYTGRPAAPGAYTVTVEEWQGTLGPSTTPIVIHSASASQAPSPSPSSAPPESPSPMDSPVSTPASSPTAASSSSPSPSASAPSMSASPSWRG